ncbi:response regulator receiver domain-containing protein [Geodermatophilus tzadiensis]|uniref:Response regulator receiver domain-containing protein n=1 Tax=Geodermatophilus tzadiensis TaxID=1137988 RepID=A0A2T0TZG3_9ACTN|nr:response regulator transcription factor [Geodermatophilus tzadiensis]PRY51062.1 response regulator receiver domain-containing protein [Geodermatophilus tzadiensis]
MVEVLVADDHAWLRSSVVELLTAAGHRVVAECEDGTSVLAAFLRTRPDVLLLDLVMPGCTGLEAARAVLAVAPGARVLMLTSSVSGAAMEEARALGVAGWLRKDDPPSLLPARVRTVAEGGTAWEPPVGPPAVR